MNSGPGSISQAQLSLLYVTVAIVGQTRSVLLASLYPTATRSSSSGERENIRNASQNMLVLPALCSSVFASTSRGKLQLIIHSYFKSFAAKTHALDYCLGGEILTGENIRQLN